MRNLYACLLSIRQIFLNGILLLLRLSLNSTELTYKTIPITSIILQIIKIISRSIIKVQHDINGRYEKNETLTNIHIIVNINLENSI
jgi:hypothetical protein